MKSLNILVASGAFKDVFSPIEVCQMIENILKKLSSKNLKLSIVGSIPMVDGGEYSSEVLLNSPNVKKIKVRDIVDPRGILTNAYYLRLDSNTAYISSSSILKLSPELEKYKNPLHLTTYGYGQLIRHAIDKGFNKLVLGIGGTSTVDGGIGMAQALGLTFEIKDDKQGDYLKGMDLPRISIIEKSRLEEKYKHIEVKVLCDGNAKITQEYIIAQKTSDYFKNEKEEIINTLHKGIIGYSKIVSKYLMANGIKRKIQCTALEAQPYFGAAGGIMLSLLALFDIDISLGVNFFCERFNLKHLIQKSDLIITGEGKFDNSLEGKTPVGISRLAKKSNKPVIYLIGNIYYPRKNIKNYFNSYVSSNLPKEFTYNGITTIISCHPFFDKKDAPKEYQKRIKFFREHDPRILSKGLKMYFRGFKQ